VRNNAGIRFDAPAACRVSGFADEKVAGIFHSQQFYYSVRRDAVSSRPPAAEPAGVTAAKAAAAV